MSDTVSLILRDLELEALRARFRLLGPAFKDFRSSSGHLWFELDDYEIVYSSDAQFVEAQSLNGEPRFMRRRIELAADGIWPTIVFSGEREKLSLTAVVKFNTRGRKVLERTGPSFSSIVRWVLTFLRSSYWILGLALVSAVLVERLYRQGWALLFVSLSLVVASSALTVWFLRRKKA